MKVTLQNCDSTSGSICFPKLAEPVFSGFIFRILLSCGWAFPLVNVNDILHYLRRWVRLYFVFFILRFQNVYLEPRTAPYHTLLHTSPLWHFCVKNLTHIPTHGVSLLSQSWPPPLHPSLPRLPDLRARYHPVPLQSSLKSFDGCSKIYSKPTRSLVRAVSALFRWLPALLQQCPHGASPNSCH